MQGKDGNDVITGGQGDDSIDGGNGIDTAIYSGSIDDYNTRSRVPATTKSP